jgi:sugar (pentulose or hexulose) kinase
MDKNLKPLSKAIMWQDKRTNYICEALEDKNDFVFERCGSRVVL